MVLVEYGLLEQPSTLADGTDYGLTAKLSTTADGKVWV